MVLELRRADAGDLEVVRSVLEEASAWLLARGIEQWPARWGDEWIVPALAEGETWLAADGGEVFGTITLQSRDDLVWPGEPPVAGYVHRLAVRRGAAGRGADLLAWGEHQVVAAGRTLVRLDCWGGNARLRAYYEAAGYRHVDDVSERTWTVSRYEKCAG